MPILYSTRAPKPNKMPAGNDSPSDRILGVVNWFDDEKGYGFISREGDEDVFVHHSAIIMEGRRKLAPQQLVEFSIGAIGGRKPSAQEVVIIR